MREEAHLPSFFLVEWLFITPRDCIEVGRNSKFVQSSQPPKTKLTLATLQVGSFKAVCWVKKGDRTYQL